MQHPRDVLGEPLGHRQLVDHLGPGGGCGMGDRGGVDAAVWPDHPDSPGLGRDRRLDRLHADVDLMLGEVFAAHPVGREVAVPGRIQVVQCEAELLGQLADMNVAAIDELAAVLADLAVGEAVRSPAAPAQSLSGLVQVGVHTHLVELVGRGDARQTRAHDHHPGVARRPRGRAGAGRTGAVGGQHRSGAERPAGGDQLPSRKPCDGLLELHRRFTRLLPQDCLGVLLNRPRDPRSAAPMRPSPFLGIVSCVHITHPPPMH